MYYGGGLGWFGWIWIGLMMIAFWALVIFLVVWAIRATRGPAPKPPFSAALNILDERFARGEISPEEFAERKRVIQGGS